MTHSCVGLALQMMCPAKLLTCWVKLILLVLQGLLCLVLLLLLSAECLVLMQMQMWPVLPAVRQALQQMQFVD